MNFFRYTAGEIRRGNKGMENPTWMFEVIPVLSQSDRPPPPLPPIQDFWLADKIWDAERGERERERERLRNFNMWRKTKKKLSHQNSSTPHCSLSLSLWIPKLRFHPPHPFFFFLPALRNTRAVLMKLALPFRCLHRGIMGAVVSSAPAAPEAAADVLAWPELIGGENWWWLKCGTVRWWEDEHQQTHRLSPFPVSLSLLTPLFHPCSFCRSSVLHLFIVTLNIFPLFSPSIPPSPLCHLTLRGGIRMGCRCTRIKVSER